MPSYKLQAIVEVPEIWVDARSEGEALDLGDEMARIEVALGAYNLAELRIVEVTNGE